MYLGGGNAKGMSNNIEFPMAAFLVGSDTIDNHTLKLSLLQYLE
jgi:hypothetical protein